MKKLLKNRLVTCILILVLASTIIVFAGDVIVKEGTGEFGNIGVGTPPVSNVGVKIYPEVTSSYTAFGTFTSIPNSDVNIGYIFGNESGFSVASAYSGEIGTLKCFTTKNLLQGGIVNNWYGMSIYEPLGLTSIDNCYGLYIGNVTKGSTNSYAIKTGLGDVYFGDDVHIVGKLTVDGDTDPKTLELQLQERNSVIERYEKYVTPDKKSGVAYINSETKRIEIYYPYEGLIRNILGETIYTLPSIRINNDCETYYVFDSLTGQVIKKQRAVYDKYRIKEGIEFDSSTGQFIDEITKEIIPKEEAIELYR